jgi:4-hydroxythreonine-4-phosphate dehydrogenase
MKKIPARLAVLGDPDLFAERAGTLKLDLDIQEQKKLSDIVPHRAGHLDVLGVSLKTPVCAGQLNSANAEYVIELLKRGVELCKIYKKSALVTAPVQKSVINQAGIKFTGHTEFLADLTGTRTPVMLLVAENMRVALATTHLPLHEVASVINRQNLKETINVLSNDLEQRFGLNKPRIVILGLNPHAGEAGVIGNEEQKIIKPLIEELSSTGLNIQGPLPADTAFTPARLAECDVILAMYHDQGLPAIKALSFGNIVNVTLGLPIIRTSVDHGTALALAGTGKAKIESLKQAVLLAIKLLLNSKSV